MSDEQKTLTIIIRGDGTQLTGTVNASTENVKRLGDALDGVGAKMKNAGKEAETAGTKIKGAADSSAESAKKAEASWSSAGSAIGLAAAAAATAVVGMVAHSVQATDELGKMAQRLGVSAEYLSTLGFAAEQNGAKLSQLDGGLTSLADNAAKAAGGVKLMKAPFDAMGISVTDSQGKLKSLDQLLPQIAAKFASYKDGPEKVALAMKLMGSEGAALIPMLNDLGTKGFDEVHAKAARLGQVLSDEDVKAATALNDQISDLHAKSAGFANNLTQAVLPTLLRLSGAFLDSGNMAATSRDKFSGINTVLEFVGSFAANAIGWIQKVGATVGYVADAISITVDRAALYMEKMKSVAAGALKGGVFGISSASSQFDQQNAQRIAELETRSKAAKQTISDMWKEIDADTAKRVGRINGTVADFSDVVSALGSNSSKALPPLMNLSRGMDQAVKAGERLNEMLARDGEILAGINAKLNPAQKLYSDYAKGIAEANIAYEKEILLAAKSKAASAEIAQAKANLVEKTKALQAVLKQETDQFIYQHDVVSRYLEKIADESALIGLTDREKEITKATQDLTRAWEKNEQGVRDWLVSMGVVDPTSEAGRAKIAALTGSLYDNRQAWDLDKQATQGWVSVFSSVGDRILQTSGNLATRFKAGWKEMIDSVISYTLKLALLNPFLNSLFGGSAGFQLLPTMANAFGGGGVPALVQTGAAFAGAGGAGGGFDLNTVGTVASLFGGGGGSSGSGLFGGISSLFSASKWIDYGKNLWGGFSTAFGNFWNGANGGMNGWNMLANGGAGEAYHFGLSNGGYGSGLGQALGIAGGIYAGYNRAQNADGVFGKVGGAAAYGLGTYALGAGLASAAGGAGFAAGVGGAFAIPVVGWVALAAMLIDKFSGGNLFGTGWHANGETKSNLSVGADGASFKNQYEEKKKSALFGGNSYRWVDTAVTDDQLNYEKQLTAAFKKVSDSSAAALGNTLSASIAAEFQQRWNKDGKVTEEISTVLGKTYKEPIEDFVKRVQAEIVLANINAARGDSMATQIADAYRSDASKLSDAAQMLLQAQVDIKKGQSLLGDSTSLSEIATLVSSLGQDNETLIQTYTRLQTETQTLRSTLDLMGVDIGKTGTEFVKFADAASNAAGGVQNLQSMLAAFQQAFYSADEITKAQIAATRKASDAALSALGLSTDISKSDFRSAYESALPTMSAEDLVRWTQAGLALDAATQAEQAYTDALKKNAADVISLLAQLNPSGDPRAGTWEGTLANINANYDAAIEKLKTLGATQEQITEAELDRTLAIANAQNTAYQNYASIVQQLEDGFASLQHSPSDFQKSLLTISQALADTEKQLNAAAKAAGMAAAREQDLALARQYAAAQAEVAANQLKLTGKDIVSQLYGQADIAAKANSVGQGMFVVAQGLTAIQNSVDKFRDSMLLDSSLSPLNTQGQYDEALKQLRATGDENTAKTALELARKLMASGDDYTQAFNLITSLVRTQPTAASGGGGGGASSSSANSAQLSELQRSQLAQQLAQNVADYAGFKNQSFGDVAKDWGFDLAKLASDLGLKNQSIDDYLKSLQAKSYSLTDLSTLVTSQVDRIIDAIRGESTPAAIVADQLARISGNKAGPVEIAGPMLDTPQPVEPVAPRPPASAKDAPVPNAVTDSLQQKLIDGQAAQTKALVDVVVSLTKTVASGATSNDEAQQKLLDALRELERTNRSVADALSAGRSSNTPNMLVRV